ncbi:MAG: anaerobic ribonucleoside-triphosphate reductase activating protein [Oscillospiraceae bacterium]|nr:anaerobic ribonucleoside-triphosphate reductase activating protein [Oscillospiraceae bacterium]
MSAAELTGCIRLAGVVRESIVDGPGIRLTVFVQGCPHHCPGCHNPDTHDSLGGYDCTLQKILDAFDADPLLRGVTLSGGEPFEQADGLLPLAQAICQRGKDVVAYSGYTFEELLEKGKQEPAVIELLSLCCLLVDGRFVKAQRDLSLRFRGSRNQRLIDPQQSLKTGISVLSEL